MSSNTRIEAAPPPPPPVEERLGGKQAVGQIPFLGAAGWGLLRDTLEQTLRPKADDPASTAWAAEWKPAKAGTGYTLRLHAAALPTEVTRHGVAEVPVTLSVGEATAQVQFELNFLVTQRLPETARQEVRAAVQRAFVRPFNQLLALAVRRHLVAQLQKNTAKLRLRQTVNSVEPKNFTLRTYSLTTLAART